MATLQESYIQTTTKIKIHIFFVTSPTQFQDLYTQSEMAMDIPAYPWTSMERMGREYPPTWEGGVARVCRGCAGAYLRKRLNPQRKLQKTTKNENQQFVATSAAQFQYFSENSMFLQRCAANSATKATALT